MTTGTHHDDQVDAVDTDPEVVRSEEVLQVGTRTVVSGRVRLRKRVVVETVTQTVELRREELVVEQETFDDLDGPSTADVDEADGVELAESLHEIVLHAERAVITKLVVPVERIRLRTHVVTGEAVITEDLRQEHVDVITESSDRS